jgi:hypothetical protein
MKSAQSTLSHFWRSMNRTALTTIALLLLLAGAVYAAENCPIDCKVDGMDATAHQALSSVGTPSTGACHVSSRNGFPIPDPNCTPGAINPTVTVEILKNHANFRTCCLRDHVESEEEKHVAYQWYGLPVPSHNSGQTQVCELDHLVPLELGGGDSMDNIWPQCGPDGVTLNERFFKQKDQVEFYLADEVKAGQMDLATAQKQIARGYTQFVDKAKTYCSTHHCA